MRKIFLMAAATTLVSASFAQPSYAENGNQYFGTLTGALVGGIIGNQFGHGNGRVATTAAGVVAGAWAGNEIGYSIDNSGQRPGPSGPSGGGYAPSGGNSGGYYAGSSASPAGYTPNYVAPNDAPTPVSAYDQSYGGYCRTYSQQVQTGNGTQETYGTACLQPDGTWRAVQ